jgi:hypothetical protein
MKPVTDAQIAKLAGIKRVEGLSGSENRRFYWRQESTGSNFQTLPAFTKSLDAITALIRSEPERPLFSVRELRGGWVDAEVGTFASMQEAEPAYVLATAYAAYKKGSRT